MKQITLSAFIVVLLIAIDITIISSAYAGTKTTIFKVTKVSQKGKLQLRAYPSTKSRIKKSLPYNAKDLTETVKKRVIKGSTQWIEVNWRNTRGWVNSHYLKKTGVLVHNTKSNKPKAPRAVASRTSRNTNTLRLVSMKPIKIQPVTPNELPQAFGGDRYDQPTQIAATEMKMAYIDKNDQVAKKILSCSGNSPEPWNINMNITNKNMQVKLAKGRTFNLPINYHSWASPNKIRMGIGGNKGRNVVDVNLEKTDACSNGLSKTNYPYKVNATINRQFFSGCCQSIRN